MKNLQTIQLITLVSLEVILCIPDNSTSLVIFAHGSGSRATSTRNQIVSQILKDSGFGTLLFYLLTEKEQESDIRTHKIMYNIPGATLKKFSMELPTERLIAVKQRVQNNAHTKDFKLGYFRASTGAAAALFAAARFT